MNSNPAEAAETIVTASKLSLLFLVRTTHGIQLRTTQGPQVEPRFATYEVALQFVARIMWFQGCTNWVVTNGRLPHVRILRLRQHP
jgi:hypothetical protein